MLCVRSNVAFAPCASVCSRQAVAPCTRFASLLPRSPLAPGSRRSRGPVIARTAGGESSASVTTAESVTTTETAALLEVELSTESARRLVVLDQVEVNTGKKITYIAGVALGSAAEAAGLKPGQELLALTHPVNYDDWWVLEGVERLRFVRDAINTRRSPSVTLRVSAAPLDMAGSYVEQGASAKEEEVEKEMTVAEKMEAQYAANAEARSKVAEVQKREREDLYSDKWEGDQYVGTGWNELNVVLLIATAVPVLGLLAAWATYGKLWGTTGYY